MQDQWSTTAAGLVRIHTVLVTPVGPTETEVDVKQRSRLKESR